jgi:hypothetical protein
MYISLSIFIIYLYLKIIYPNLFINHLHSSLKIYLNVLGSFQKDHNLLALLQIINFQWGHASIVFDNYLFIYTLYDSIFWIDRQDYYLRHLYISIYILTFTFLIMIITFWQYSFFLEIQCLKDFKILHRPNLFLSDHQFLSFSFKFSLIILLEFHL